MFGMKQRYLSLLASLRSAAAVATNGRQSSELKKK